MAGPRSPLRLEERRGGQPGRIPWTISSATYLAWRGQSSSIEEIGARRRRFAVAETRSGLMLGLAAAAGLVRALSTILYGVRPYDAVTFMVVPLVILTVAALACAAPVWCATRIDPLKALRSQ